MTQVAVMKRKETLSGENGKNGNWKLEKKSRRCNKQQSNFYPHYGSMLRLGRASWQFMRMMYG
jgi:hypothetical protein